VAQRTRDCGVWLAAHRKINHLILSALPQAIRQRIEANLALDLVHAEKVELLEVFAPQLASNPSISNRAPASKQNARKRS